jgi:hypothetical protein
MRSQKKVSPLLIVVILLISALSTVAFAGGPLAVSADAKPVIWNPAAMPIKYRVDGGPLSATPAGVEVVPNSVGVSRVAGMFAVWSGVSTAQLSFQNAGFILQAGSYTGSDVKTVSDFNAVLQSCSTGAQTPIVFDADGSLERDLIGDPGVLGFTGLCSVQNGFVNSAFSVMNGIYQDGINSGNNYELTATEFDETFVHEFGHLIGLDHSQINVNMLQSTYPCDVTELAGQPLMFPFAFCQARLSAQLPQLAPDDKAWISKLYPSSSFSTSYGTISGRIYFGNGTAQMSNVNVIARQIGQSRAVAFSAVSGLFFTGAPGQSLTSPSTMNWGGSRDKTLVGYYEIPVLPGTYSVEIEAIYTGFTGGSSVGPIGVPFGLTGPAEFWNPGESRTDDPATKGSVTVGVGETKPNIDIILNDSLKTFDDFEDPGASLWNNAPPLSGREELGRLA